MLLLALVWTCLTAVWAVAQDFKWVRDFQASGNFEPRDMARDQDGNLIVVGVFSDSVDLDPGPGVFQVVASLAAQNGFVMKLDSAGQFIWGGSFGSAGNSGAFAVDVNPAGDIFIEGSMQAPTDLDPGSGADSTSPPHNGLYLVRLSSAGQYLWGNTLDRLEASALADQPMALDGNGNVYLCGSFSDTVDFDMGPGAHLMAPRGAKDGFLARYDDAGGLDWVLALGGGSMVDLEEATALQVGPAGVYVAGYFGDSADFDPGPGTVALTNADAAMDGFVARYTLAGGLVWARQIVADASIAPSHLALDDAGNVFIGANFSGNVDVDPGTALHPLTAFGALDCYLSHWNANGDFVWSLRAGGTGLDNIAHVNVDRLGYAYMSLYWAGTIRIETPQSFVLTLNSVLGSLDFALVRVQPIGELEWTVPIGGNASDYLSHTIVTDDGDIYGLGEFANTVDFGPYPSPNDVLTTGPYGAGFLFKWGQSGFVGTNEAADGLAALTLFPNPCVRAQSEGTVHLRSSEPLRDLRIMNALGQVMNTQSHSSTTALEWAVRDWPAGMYLVQARNRAGQVTLRRLVVE